MKLRSLTGALTALTVVLWVVAIGLMVEAAENRIRGVIAVFGMSVALASLAVAGFASLREGQPRRGGARSTTYRASVARDHMIAAPAPRPSATRNVDGPTERLAAHGAVAVVEEPFPLRGQAYWDGVADSFETLFEDRDDDPYDGPGEDRE